VSRIFLSHSSKDNRQAQALRNWLVSREPQLTNEIFLDTDPVTGLKPGVKWKDALVSANSRCEVVICLLSDRWEASPECRTEYRTAENMGKRIMCARLQDRASQFTGEWEDARLFVDGLPDDKLESIAVEGGPPVVLARIGLHQLLDAIRGAGIGADNFEWPPPGQAGRAPYRGWEPFEEADAGVFFGRDTQIVRALDMLRTMRNIGVDSLFVVQAPSGSGKSSFLRAGLLPRLRREDRHFVLLDTLRPERHALTGETGLAQSIYAGRCRLGLTQPPRGDIEIACTTTDPVTLRTLLTECRSAAAARLPHFGLEAEAPTLVLPLDQAEELFAADAGPEAEGLLELIAQLVRPDTKGQRLGLIVAGAVRTDRYEAMQMAPQLAEVTSEIFDDLKPMPDNQFRQVITGPAQRATAGARRLSIAPDLVDELIDDAAEGADCLPLLALTLRRLYDRYGATKQLTRAHYHAIGGLERIVRTAVEEVLSRDADERSHQLATLRTAFIPWLATINPENDQPLRRVARYSDLPESSWPLVEKFVDKRLLIKDRRGGEDVVEVALESLLRQWGELASWLREERQHLVAADDIERAAVAWRNHQHDPAWLLTSSRLEDAEALIAEPGYHNRLARYPTSDYLIASRQAENARLSSEEEHRQAALRYAQESQQAAEAHAANEKQHAAVLRKRNYILCALLAVALVFASIAFVWFAQAQRGKEQAISAARDSLAAQLETEASAIFSRATATGGDLRAIADVLAAQHLRSDSTKSRGAIYTANAALSATRVIIPTGQPGVKLALSRNGQTLASGSNDRTVRLWDMADAAHPKALSEIAGLTGAVASLAFSPDGRTVAFGINDNTIQLWDVTRLAAPVSLGQPLTGHTGMVWSVAFSPDGHTLVSGSDDKTVRLWDVTDRAHPAPLGQPLTGHTGTVWTVAFSPDGRTLASGSTDKTVRFWNVTDPAHISSLGDGWTVHDAGVDSVAFSPDGRTLATGSADLSLRLWDVSDPAHLVTLGQPLTGHSSEIHSVAFSPDGRTVASAGNDNTVRLWDVSDPANPVSLGRPLTGHTGSVWSVAFSPDGQTLMSGSNDGTIRLWNLGGALPMRGHTDAVEDVTFSADGRTLASSSADRTVRLWNLSDPARPKPWGQPMTGHTGTVWSTAFSPDGKTLASASADKSIRLWDATDPAHPNPLEPPLVGHTDAVNSVAFSPDGRTLASGSDDYTVRLWDVTDRAHPAPLGQPLTGHFDGVWSVAFSPDGRTLASGSDDYTVRLWDVTDRAHPAPLGQPLTGHTNVLLDVVFSPDGHTLASASADDSVRLWDVTDRAHPVSLGQPLTGHTDIVRTASFAPSGDPLASGGDDYTLRLWELTDPAHPAPLGQPLTGHSDYVSSVVFSPNGRLLASGSADKTVRLWPTPVDATVANLCSKLTSNMSHRDWREWISPTIPYVTLCPDLPVPQG
jgi:WD40 repeat protein